MPRPPLLDTQVDANLVMRRPDLQVSEMQARPQSAQIGVAETALYPSFSLFGSIGFVFVVWELKIRAATVNIKVIT